MKQILRITAALALVMSLCACGQNEQDGEQSPSGSTGQTETAAPEETAAAESVPETTETEPVTAETPAVEEEVALPPLELSFSSGAFGWGTVLSLNSDGSFTGGFHDSDMGSIGDDYPNGTYYTCQFTGRFEDIHYVDAFTVSLTLTELTTFRTEGESWIEDGVLYIASYPYGLEDCTEFLLYLPGTPVEGLSEEFRSWLFLGDAQALEGYALRNTEKDYGFVSMDY